LQHFDTPIGLFGTLPSIRELSQLVSSPQPLRRECASGRRLLYSWRASGSGCPPRPRGGAQAFSSMRERAGWSASLPPAGEAQRVSARRPSSAASPEFRRSGGRGCSAASSDLNQRLHPAADRDKNRRLPPRPTTYPQRRDRNYASNLLFQYLFYERHIDKQHSRKDVSKHKVSSTPPPDRGRS
jgi:hypothetical protein